jgi:hypothetical protein
MVPHQPPQALPVTAGEVFDVGKQGLGTHMSSS